MTKEEDLSCVIPSASEVRFELDWILGQMNKTTSAPQCATCADAEALVVKREITEKISRLIRKLTA